MFLHTIIVDKEHRNKGVGKLLMDKITQEAKRLGVRTIESFAELDNKVMVKKFQEQGYKKGKKYHFWQLDLETI